ncbi:hypothetical protein JCM6882_004871 [Rhodosporidiobolus microsporus]
MVRTYDFRVTYNSTTRRFRVPREPALSWTQLAELVKKRFDLPASSSLAILHHDGKEMITVDSEEDMPFLRDGIHNAEWSRTYASLEARLTDGAIKQEENAEDGEEENKTVDILLGVHPEYRAVSIPLSPPPSLEDVLSLAKSRLADSFSFPPSPTLFLVDRHDRLVALKTEEDWQRWGWKTAVSLFEKAQGEGLWEAASFHVGTSHSALPLSPSSTSTFDVLSSPSHSAVDKHDLFSALFNSGTCSNGEKKE